VVVVHDITELLEGVGIRLGVSDNPDTKTIIDKSSIEQKVCSKRVQESVFMQGIVYCSI
jgi:hypothetical protein